MDIKNLMLLACLVCAFVNRSALAEEGAVLKAGHPSLKEWILPTIPVPKDNALTVARVDLGRILFFDPRLSGDGNMSCATCHNPALGWSDGLATAKGVNSKVLGRASPTISNAAFNTILMWDGRKRDLEDQATGPLQADLEMHVDTVQLFKWMNSVSGYRSMFEAAYPGEGINAATFSKAMASFERTIIMRDTPFDKWLAGDAKALTAQQVRGFGIFLDANKGNCASCHSAPNFTDNGFHNVGLASWGNPNPDVGRFTQKPLARMQGAFKTPQLRGITLTAPYFHDGSAKTLLDVVNHYVKGGVATSNLDPNLQPLSLSEQERLDLVAFMNALTGTTPAITIPTLPQ